MEALIVEDNEFFRAFLREHLSSIRPQLKIHEAAGVVDGRRLALKYFPELVFVDVHLPGGNGLELTGQIRKELPASTIVVCSSLDLSEYHEFAILCGATHFLPKQDLSSPRAWDPIRRLLRRPSGPDGFTRP
jgi:DNA-binding NarL/FixJ family response regulator